MVRSSYSDVFDISHERELDEQILAGDLVRTGANAFPHFRVIAVYCDKVWLRDVQYGSDGVTNLALCRKINGPLTAEAAE
ncbi:MAG: hypothetical protein ACXWK0_07010 [Caulobacteraceae bacterium]